MLRHTPRIALFTLGLLASFNLWAESEPSWHRLPKDIPASEILGQEGKVIRSDFGGVEISQGFLVWNKRKDAPQGTWLVEHSGDLQQKLTNSTPERILSWMPEYVLVVARDELPGSHERLRLCSFSPACCGDWSMQSLYTFDEGTTIITTFTLENGHLFLLSTTGYHLFSNQGHDIYSAPNYFAQHPLPPESTISTQKNLLIISAGNKRYAFDITGDWETPSELSE